MIDAKGIAMSEQASGPALPGEDCRVPPHESWSDLEKWVWQEVGSGRIADINQKLGWCPLPKDPDGWGPERRLSARFLETILLHDPWRSAITHRGVRIVGALFDEPVDLVEAKIAHEFWLARSRFTSNVDFHRIRTRSLLSLDGSVFTGTLTMAAASIGGALFMREGAEFAEVILRGAKIGGQLSLTGAKVTGTLDMDSASIGGALFMSEGAEFAEVILRGAHIGGQLSLIGAKVTGTLDLDSASIGGALLMRDGAEFAEVDLRSAKIGGQLSLSDAKVSGTLNMDSASIGGSLLMNKDAELLNVSLVGAKIGSQLALERAKITGKLDMEFTYVAALLAMREAKFSKPVDLVYVKLGGSLDLRGAVLAGLDLTGTQIAGELHIASKASGPSWADGARLILRNTSVAAVQDEPHIAAWPMQLDLQGFTYKRFGGLGGSPEAVVGGRGSRWFIEWLARDEPYTPQPYHQCAEVLREMGHPEMANDVLHAGRERERAEAAQREEHLRWIGLSLLSWTIGYGYGQRYFRSLWWVAGITVLGSMMLLIGGQSAKIGGGLVAGLFFSLDLLLPIIQLHEPHYRIGLDGLAKYYFAIHKLMGYVLASFLIAGLAGLTK